MNKHKVLIVEDEVLIAIVLKNKLAEFNYMVVDVVHDPNKVLSSIKRNNPDIILMDINLKSKKDGIDIVNIINLDNNIPIIYLTAANDENTITRAIKTKPVGYILKPYKKQELDIAIRLGIYRYQDKEIQNEKQLKSLGHNYFFDERRKKLYYGEMMIKLGKKEVKLLDLLIDAEGKVVYFETIENVVWEGNPVSKDSIRKMIYKIRTKMEYKFIKGVANEGYSF